jgi:arginyl-tRNA synthetase
MNLNELLIPKIENAVKELFGVIPEKLEFQATRKDFEGDITLVVFPLLKQIKGNPAQIGQQLGDYLAANCIEVERYNVVAGFLNIVISDAYYLNFLNEIKNKPEYGFKKAKVGDKSVLVEYSSPNTNKPLHLGHVRNNLLGYSVSEILKASGKNVHKVQIINDRGIHICKSMLAWQKFGHNETPETSGLKGDKLVGKYYVEFEKQFQKEYSTWLDHSANTDFIASKNDAYSQSADFKKLLKEKYEAEASANNEGELRAICRNEFKKHFKNEYFNNHSELGRQAQQMLLDWEAGNPAVVSLWKTMNQWVYDGFEQTYKNLGVDFDKYYYESDTYLLGKDVVQMGLEKGVFKKDPDGSVWIDLTAEGLDRKIVLRSDGTAVYMTQDIGTAIQRVKDFQDVGGMVYTVGNEQDYHFKVLFLILQKLGFDWAKDLFHLSYGMVDLPSGKMKSREGTVVDTDDLMIEMDQTAEKIAIELGKLEDFSAEEKKKLYHTIGMGALKYYILKVDPKKRILFNPEESVEFTGNTGPFIQYTYARIQSLLRKASDLDIGGEVAKIELHEKEKELLKWLTQFPEVVQSAAQTHSPALVANYVYEVVKEFNSFYQTVPINMGEPDEVKRIFRLQLSKKVGEVIASAFGLLGISVPERM